jgi:hypothetical protein
MATMPPNLPQSAIPADISMILQSYMEIKPPFVWANPRFIEVSYRLAFSCGWSAACLRVAHIVTGMG